MQEAELDALLNQLIASWESELVEFKEAPADYSISDIGKYFSALANEANLRKLEKAWLIFGVSNKTRKITGTDYRRKPEDLQQVKSDLKSLEPSLTFRNIFELKTGQGRVVLMEIPPAPRGVPVAWNGHFHGRKGESIAALGMDKLDEIRNQTHNSDWSAEIVPDATADDLDPEALKKAREGFIAKKTDRITPEEVQNWSDMAFLEKIRLVQKGKITRAGLLLLGKPETANLLSPNPAELDWKLEGQEQAYEHFYPPFLLATTRLYQRIRNIQLRILPQDELLPIEVSKYDQKAVLEAMHNCIAHQDYSRNGRVVVTEKPDRLTFENSGSFFEAEPTIYVLQGHTPQRYRNVLLATAMVHLNMVDRMGQGIQRMYKSQVSRYAPLPEYEFTDGSSVRLTVYGAGIDSRYSRLLMKKTDLPLEDVLALDRVEKKLPIPDDVTQRLRRAGLIEGRKPNLHISAVVAEASDSRADYIHTRALDDDYYKKLIVEYLTKFKHASRADVDKLLHGKLSNALSAEQKGSKISNLLSALSRSGKIRNTASRKTPRWELAE